MKKIFLTGFLALLFTLSLTPSVLAQNKSKTLVKLPTFMAGEIQLVDKTVDSDLMISGKEIKISSNINGDAYVAGSHVDISGSVNGNLIVVGGEVTISGKVSKNLIMLGGQAVVKDTAEIGGYVLAGGRKIDLSGKFMGPVKLGAETLIVGPKTVINGNLEADVSLSDISSDAKIVGEKNIRIYETKKVETQTNQWKSFSSIGEVLSFLSKLLVLLILVKLFGPKIKQINLQDSFWSSIGSGLLVLIVTPILALLLMITLIALPISVIILALYFIGLYLSTILSSILVGNYLSKIAKLKANNYVQGFLGLILITLIEIIPFVGGLTKFLLLLLGIGIIFKSLKKYFSKPILS